jgi:hypothetical protein
MELTTIRAELQIALDITSQWKESGEVSEIERDIVLEKLRNSYSALCHMNVATPSAPSSADTADSEEQPFEESIDLTAVLGLSHPSQPSVSVAPATDADHTVTPDAASPSQSETSTATEPQPETTFAIEPETETEEVSTPDTETSDAPASEPDILFVEDTPTPIVVTTDEPDEAVSEATETEPEAAETESSETTSTPAPSQPVAESATTSLTSAETPDDNDAFSVTEISSPAQASEVAPAAEVSTPSSRRTHDYESPSLFDINQIETKRKHKIVLSLYGSTPSERPRTTSKPTEPTPNRHVATAPDTPTPSAESQTPPQTSVPVADLAAENGAHTVGDSFRGDVVRLSDVLQAQSSGTAVGQEVVTSIRQALCNNDLYLLARDLFGGDMEACEHTIKQLDRFDDLDECMIYITEHYNWNPNSAGTKLLVDLIERKLI